MKNRWILLLPVIFLMTTNACQNPLENVTIGFKDPIENGIVEIRFRSLKGPIPKTVALALTGPDASQVVTTLNTTNYKVNEDGMLLLAASPESNYSKTDPLTFTVAARANGYLDILQPVQLADTGRQALSPAWINLNNPPPHLSAVQTTGFQTPSASAMTISTPAFNQKKDNITVLIPAGSEFQTTEGSTLAGPFTAAVQHMENRGNNPADYLPSGAIMPGVTGLSAENLGSLQLSQIAGAFSLELYNDAFQVAEAFSKPILYTMALNPATVNPVKGVPVQPGDEIPVYRYERFRNRWHQEKPVLVSRNSATGQPECRLSSSRPGLWVMGWTQAVCDAGPVFTVKSLLKQVDIRFLCKVVDANTRQEISSFYASLNDGERLVLTHLRQNQQIRLQVYNVNDAYRTGNPGQPILETGPLLACNQTPQPLDLQKLPVPPAITVRFDFVCPPPTQLNQSLLPAKLRLQYSESGQRNWRDLVTLNRDNPKAVSSKLQLKQPYDIRVSTDGGASWPLEKSRFVPNNNTLAFELASPEFCK
ncbi:hypothetical protein GCM10027299_00770 [Larkinella ripae]